MKAIFINVISHIYYFEFQVTFIASCIPSNYICRLFRELFPIIIACENVMWQKDRTFSYYNIISYSPFFRCCSCHVFYSNIMYNIQHTEHTIESNEEEEEEEISNCLHNDSCVSAKIHKPSSNQIKRDDFCISIIKMKCLIIIQKKIEYLFLFLLIKS